MKNISIICLIMALLSTIACNTDDDLIFDQYFNLSFEKSVTIPQGNFDIAFINLVEESRCPSSLDCIWEGRAVVSLAIIGGETINIELATENSMDGTSKLTAIHNNHLIKLLTINPHPTNDVLTPEEDYEVILEVTEL